MFCKCSKKSLIVSAALLATMICTGVVAASAHTVLPDHSHAASPDPQGIPAIPPPRDHTLLSVPTVIRYLRTRGFVGGPTSNGTAPGVQSVRLTDADTLNRLAHIFLPGLPATAKVYYTRLKGPFAVSATNSRPVLRTLLPGANNLPALRTLLPDMSHTPGLNQLLPLLSKPVSKVAPGLNTPTGEPASYSSAQKPQTSAQTRRAPVTRGKTQQGKKGKPRKPASLGKLPGTHHPGLGTILQEVYEVFDAHSGNLLAWG
ncbi:MAG TPA: hypothetical protein VGF67_29035 [Ktedonobacteraceae bacterium]|jgi:hypothetical protein